MHLARVLRAEPGQVFDVVADGVPRRAEVTEILRAGADGEPEVHFLLHEALAADAPLPLHLLLAIFKFDHLEWALEKATELGVERISPVVARRTEKHLAQAAGKRVERWRRIVLEAAKQSRRSAAPEVRDPQPLRSALAADASSLQLLLSEMETSTSLAELLRGSPDRDKYSLAVGPEGGWAPDELDLFARHGWQPVTLGPRILRAETAAIAAVSIASALL